MAVLLFIFSPQLTLKNGTGYFFDSAEKPSVHPSRASGRTEER